MLKDILLSALLHRRQLSTTRTCQHCSAEGARSTYSNVVISASGCQSSLAVWFEVRGVYWGTQFMPVYQQRRCFHVSELLARRDWASYIDGPLFLMEATGTTSS
jgi:hypothetical protein